MLGELTEPREYTREFHCQAQFIFDSRIMQLHMGVTDSVQQSISTEQENQPKLCTVCTPYYLLAGPTPPPQQFFLELARCTEFSVKGISMSGEKTASYF